MKLITKILAALAIGAAATTVAHAGWESIDDTHSWNTERVHAVGRDRTIFVREVKAGKSPNGKHFASITTARTISCSSFSIRVKAIAFFDRQGNQVDGAELFGRDETIYPDTAVDRLAQTVCSRSGTTTAQRSELARLQALAADGLPKGAESLAYADRIRNKIVPNLILDRAVEGNPSTVLTMRLARDGTLLSSRITKSSGDATWDDAVLRAIERSTPLPRDENGKAPADLTMSFSPQS